MKPCFLAVLPSFFLPFYASAQVCGENCTTPPTCTQMGYKPKSDIYCENGYISCPFDSSYIWCKEYTCEDGRYYSKPLNSADGYSCTSVKYHGLTCYECQLNPCYDYTLSSCPDNGICSKCTSGSTTKYKLDSCYQGYVISGNSCVLQCSAGYEPHDDSVSCSDSFGCSSYQFDPNNEWCSTCSKKNCPITSPYCSKSACQSGGRACTESPKMKGCYGFETLTPLPQCSDGYTFGLLICPENSYGCTKREIDPQNSKCAKCVTSSCPSDYPYCSLEACEDGKPSDQTCINSPSFPSCYKRTTFSTGGTHKCCEGKNSGDPYYYCVDADKCLLEPMLTTCPQDPDTGVFPRPETGTCP